MFVTIIFSFSHKVFQKSYSCTKQCHILTHLRYIAVENIARKGEIACNKHFLLFSQSFLPYIAPFFFIVNALKKCSLQFVLNWICTACPYITEILLKMVLTHYHTLPHFDTLKSYSCRKHCEKRRNCSKQTISPFLTKFSILYGT